MVEDASNIELSNIILSDTNGNQFSGNDWVGRYNCFSLNCEYAKPGAQIKPDYVFLNFEITISNKDLYDYFPFEAVIKLDNVIVDTAKFTEDNQTYYTSIKVRNFTPQKLEIISEQSGCTAKKGLGEDIRDLALHLSKFSLSTQKNKSGLKNPSKFTPSFYELISKHISGRKGFENLPQSVVFIKDEHIKFSNQYNILRDNSYFLKAASYVSFDLDIAKIRGYVINETLVASDVLLQVQVCSECFKDNAPIHLEILVNGKRNPSMVLVVDKDQTVSAALIPLSLEVDDKFKVQIFINGAEHLWQEGGDKGLFDFTLFAANKHDLLSDIEKMSVFLYSVARSGTTWVGDICWMLDEIAVIDEPALPRMLGIFDNDPVRNYAATHECGDVDDIHLKCYEPDTLIGDMASPIGFPHSELLERQMITFKHARNNIWAPHSIGLLHEAFREAQLLQPLREYGIGWYKSVLFKCPNDSQIADLMSIWLPSSKAIALTRDGRDVMASRFSKFGSDVLENSTDKNLREYAIRYFSYLWKSQMEIIDDAVKLMGEKRCMKIKYENVRYNTISLVEALANFMNLKRDDDVIIEVGGKLTFENLPAEVKGGTRRIQQGKLNSYKDKFSNEEIELMTNIMRPILLRHGYDIYNYNNELEESND